MKDDKYYDLAVMASGLVKDLGYETEPELKSKSAGEFCRAWLNFLIDNRDSEGFRLRVNRTGNLPGLIQWADEARSALSVA